MPSSRGFPQAIAQPVRRRGLGGRLGRKEGVSLFVCDCATETPHITNKYYADAEARETPGIGARRQCAGGRFREGFGRQAGPTQEKGKTGLTKLDTVLQRRMMSAWL